MRELHAVLVTSFLIWNSWLAFSPVFPLHVSDLGFSYFHLGILLAIPSSLSILLTLPAGAFAYQKRKQVILFSLAIQSTSFLVFGFLSDWVMLSAAQILYGLAASFFPPIITATVNSLARPASRGKAFGLFFTINGTAAILGPLLGSLLLQFLNTNVFFLLLSLFPAAGFLIYLSSLMSRVDTVPASVRKRSEGIGSILRVLRNLSSVSLCSSQFLLAIASGMFITVFSIYVRDTLVISSALVSSLFMIKGISNTLVRWPSGRISDTIGRKKPLVLSYVLLMTVFYLFSEANTLASFVLVMAVYGVAFGLRIPPQTALACDLVSSEDASVGMALLQTMFPLGFTIGSILSGWLAMTVSIQTIFRLSSLMLAPAIIVLLTIKERRNNVGM